MNQLIRDLADWDEFKGLVKLQKADENNATREELVLKFFAYLNDRDAFKGAVDAFLNNYMEVNSSTFDVVQGRHQFEEVVLGLRNIGPVPFLRTRTSVSPKNQLEAVMVAAAEVLETKGDLRRQEPNWLDDPVLVAASTGATNTRKKLRDRVDRARDMLSPV